MSLSMCEHNWSESMLSQCDLELPESKYLGCKLLKTSNPPILIFGCGNMDQKRQINIAILQREACFQKEVSCFGERSQS